MIVPSVAEIRATFSRFAREENLSWGLLLQPSRIIDILFRHRFIHFLIVGGGGLFIGLGVTWLFTAFVFGLEGYFTSYLIGTAAAIAFNFTLYTYFIFRTSREHSRRLAIYFIYIVAVITIQAQIVKTVTPLLGLEWYLAVITLVIGIFSVINFFVFKLSIFRDRE